jgi:P27 family predicted phage terminase small subunit
MKSRSNTLKRKNITGIPGLDSTISEDAKRWYDTIIREYQIVDEAGLLLLRQAMAAYDRANEARRILKAEGITVKDKYGQFRPHPAAGIERDAMKNLLAYLRALNLDVEPIRPGPGRPPRGAR